MRVVGTFLILIFVGTALAAGTVSAEGLPEAGRTIHYRFDDPTGFSPDLRSAVEQLRAKADGGNFCAGAANMEFFQARLANSASEMAIPAEVILYDPLNIGYCWWTSRFQRNAAYLVDFAPQEKKPSVLEAREIIEKITAGNQVVVIPGFRSLLEFGAVYAPELSDQFQKDRLNETLQLGFMKGVNGKSRSTPTEVKALLDTLYDEVEVKKRILFQIQRFDNKAIGAHSWLLLGMKKEKRGYELFVKDPSLQETTTKIEYQFGDRLIKFNWIADAKLVGLPHTYDSEDNYYREVLTAILHHCRPEVFKATWEVAAAKKARNEIEEIEPATYGDALRFFLHSGKKTVPLHTRMIALKHLRSITPEIWKKTMTGTSQEILSLK